MTKEDLWVVPMSGTRAGKPEPFLATNYRGTDASFSPDGRFVAYVSDESGASEVYVREFPPSSGRKRIVSHGGGYQPRWRSDGKELYYVTPDRKVVAVPITLGTSVQVGSRQVLFDHRGATSYTPAADGQRFLLDLPAGGESAASIVNVVLHWTAEINR